MKRYALLLLALSWCLVVCASGCKKKAIPTAREAPATKKKAPATKKKARSTPRDPLADLFTSTPECQLPVSTTARQKPMHMTIVEINQKALLVNRKKTCDVRGGKVDPRLKKSKWSYLILPLQEQVKEAAAKRKKLAKLNKAIKFVGKYTLVVDRKTPFKLLMEVIYTTSKAGFYDLELLTCTRATKACRPRVLPIKWYRKKPLGEFVMCQGKSIPIGPHALKPMGPRVKYTNQDLTVAANRTGFVILLKGEWLEQGCNSMTPKKGYKGTTIPMTKDKKYDYGALAKCLQKLRKAYPKEKVASFVGNHKLPYHIVIKSLDVMRGSSSKPMFPCLMLSAGRI